MRNSAFTLVELLVVIAVIALLAMLLMPTFDGATARARNVQCQNHLKRIGEAVEGRRAVAEGAPPLEAFGWPGELTKYLGEEGSLVLACPEADGIPEGGGLHKPLEEFACIAYHPNHTNRKEFIESGRMAKASQTQFDRLGGNANPRVMRDHWATGEGYKDDGKGVIYWGYEDQRVGGDDYQDVFVKETLTPDGRSQLLITSETAGKPCIWDKKNQVVLAHYDEINRYYAIPRNSPKSKTVYVESGSGTGSNYAMNSHTVGNGVVGKIQALDYVWVIARSTDFWDESESFDTDGDNELDFARHQGRLNVLFFGGGVQSMSPEEIDPSVLDNRTGHWMP